MCLQALVGAGGLKVASTTRHVLVARDLVTRHSCVYVPAHICEPLVIFLFGCCSVRAIVLGLRQSGWHIYPGAREGKCGGTPLGPDLCADGSSDWEEVPKEKKTLRGGGESVARLSPSFPCGNFCLAAHLEHKSINST